MGRGVTLFWIKFLTTTSLLGPIRKSALASFFEMTCPPQTSPPSSYFLLLLCFQLHPGEGGDPFLDQVLDHLLSLFKPALPMYLVCSLKTDQPTVLSSSLMEHCHQPGHVSYHLNILWFSLPVWWYYPINQLHSVSSTISLQILINILTFSGSVFKPSSLPAFKVSIFTALTA